ncbi:MAG: hypothetical protein BWK79_16255 [Beggiatoa sp. IS2]|nr:MAG: hypothetical protein BWK79_16255 [Beggiatoa sp. IS2]
MSILINLQKAIGAVLLSLLLVTVGFAAPTNDDLNKAITINPDTNLSYSHTQNTKDATLQLAEKLPNCSQDREPDGSVWYQYTSSADQRVTFSTRGSDYDTVLSVWTGAGHPLTEVACNDDNGGLASELGVNIAAGTIYYVNISAKAKSPGVILEDTGLLILTMSAPPANDNWANATFIVEIPYQLTQATGGASLEKSETAPSCAPTADSSVWFLYTPTTDYNGVSFSTAGSNYDTVLSVWQGDGFPLTELLCSDNAVVEEQSLTSYLTVPVTANTSYYIDVSGVAGGSGQLNLKVQESQRDFNIAIQPADTTILVGKMTVLTVELSNLEGKTIVTGIGDQWANGTAEPFVYAWYEGDSGDTSHLVASSDNNTLVTPALDKTTRYWAQITNPTGRVNSQVATVTVTDNPNDVTDNTVPSLPTLGPTQAIDSTGQSITVASTFTGGISINGGEYLPKAAQNLADTVDVLGFIMVAPEHVGETVNIFVYAETTFPNVEGTFYYMLRDGLNIEVWNQQPADLAAFKRNVKLASTVKVSLYQGTFFYTGALKIYFGYQLSNGTVVSSSEPIDVTIN